jgi:hypothetical protein
VIRVVMCRVGAEPVVEEISELGEDWQKIVGGFFEVTSCFPIGVIVSNEDAVRLKLEPNRDTPRAGIIRGDFFVTEFPSEEGDARELSEDSAANIAGIIRSMWPKVVARGKAVAHG